jgi:transposase-like protein
MRDEASIQRQLERERSFRPPYCPNRNCKHHLGGQDFWQRDGKKRIKRFPYHSQRFRCRSCDRTFAYSFFFLQYQQHTWGKNELIYQHHRIGVSARESGRILGHSERMIRGRKKKMARWGLLVHAKFLESLKIEEEIVYDGLENFAYSQYDPNNLNHAVGKRSLFTYDFNLCPLNRKGRMSPAQLRRKKKIEETHGAYPRDAIRTSTRRVFERLLKKCNGTLVLYADRHFQYRRVVEKDLKEQKIEHIKISSKAYRNFRNPLFAVNNIDMQARHCLAAFRRETIAFSKHSVAMQESFVLYMLHRNYMRPKFYGTHRSDPECSKKSPAMELKLTDRILTFKELFGQRVLRIFMRTGGPSIIGSIP